jgi:hypothetical protein
VRGWLFFGLPPGYRRRGEWLERGLLCLKSVCRLLEPVLVVVEDAWEFVHGDRRGGVEGPEREVSPARGHGADGGVVRLEHDVVEGLRVGQPSSGSDERERDRMRCDPTAGKRYRSGRVDRSAVNAILTT